MQEVNTESHDLCVYAYKFHCISHNKIITMASSHAHVPLLV